MGRRPFHLSLPFCQRRKACDDVATFCAVLEKAIFRLVRPDAKFGTLRALRPVIAFETGMLCDLGPEFVARFRGRRIARKAAKVFRQQKGW